VRPDFLLDDILSDRGPLLRTDHDGLRDRGSSDQKRSYESGDGDAFHLASSCEVMPTNARRRLVFLPVALSPHTSTCARCRSSFHNRVRTQFVRRRILDRTGSNA
jgi:hypothetical protein